MPIPCAIEDYRPYLQGTFTLTEPSGTLRVLRLEEAKSHIEDEFQTCFSLFFSSTGDALPQQSYSVRHDTLGEFPLFLVPIRKKRDGILYEAVFNLLKDPAQ